MNADLGPGINDLHKLYLRQYECVHVFIQIREYTEASIENRKLEKLTERTLEFSK